MNVSLFKKYINYLKDNPKGYWFKRKLYGWGWTPAIWQGWLVVIVFVAIILSLAFTVDEESLKNGGLIDFFVPIFILIAALIGISYWKGEKPKWQWGFPKKDKKEEN